MNKLLLALLLPLLALGQSTNSQRPVQVNSVTHQVAYPTNFFQTNAVAMSNALNLTSLATSTNGEWALFGFGFKGGQSGWPPFGVEESAFPVYSVNGEHWAGGVGYSPFTGISNAVRDVSLVSVRDIYGMAYTATTASNVNAGSAFFPIHTSQNLSTWSHITNISFLMPGETFTTNVHHWSPIFTVVGTNVWMYASVTTNGFTSFKQRYRTTSVAAFPYGWSAVAEMNNGTGLTNIIDLTPFVATNGEVYAWFKNENTATANLGKFATPSPSAAFSIVLADRFGSVEGFFMVRMPNGQTRAYMTRYLYGDFYVGSGNDGGGQTLSFSETASEPSGWGTITNWSSLTNCTVPHFLQNFKPLVVQTARERNDALSATVANSGLRGLVNIGGHYGRGPAGLSMGGFAFTNPWPADYIQGLNTNDYAGINFGNENRTRGGIYAQNDGRVSIYAPSFTASDRNIAVEYAKDVLTARSNRVDISVPLYGNGGGLTNLQSTNMVFSAASAGFTATTAIYWTNGPIQNYTVTGATTFTIPEPTGANTNLTITVRLNLIGSNTITWPSVINGVASLTITNKFSSFLFDWSPTATNWLGAKLR